MVVSKKLILFAVGLISIPALFAADPLKSLSRKLCVYNDKTAAPSIAVLNFTYPRGRMSTGSHLVSERLITYFVQGKAAVIERRLIPKIMEERRLLETGMLNASSLKMMGPINGVDAVVLGTLNDLSDNETEVMARLVEVGTGKVLASESVVMPRSWLDLPRQPRQSLPRVPVPDINPGPEVMEQRAPRPYRLSDIDPKRSKSRYPISPVPGFLPSFRDDFKKEEL